MAVQYNECSTCGAKDGRAGKCFGKEGSPIMECENCYKTRKTGVISIFTHLRRTDEELQKTFAILTEK